MDLKLLFTSKEDLRLQILNLQKQLLESEKERKNLEKACSMLIGAYKEDEKMRYKALNSKHEKFIEDCLNRKRRNESILKSLCRIEDGAKELFTRTKRLKFLKDLYISYMKVYDIARDELSVSAEQPAAISIPLKSSNGDKYSNKSTHRKTLSVVDSIIDQKVKEPVKVDETPSFQVDNNDRTAPENYYKTLYEFYAEKYKTPAVGSSFAEELDLSSKNFKVNYPDVSTSDKSFSENLRKNCNEDNFLKSSKNFKELSPNQSDKMAMNEFNLRILRNPEPGNQIVTSDNIFESVDKKSDVAILSNDSTNKLINLKEKYLNEVKNSREKLDFQHQESIVKLKSALLNKESKNKWCLDKIVKGNNSQGFIEKDEIENNEKNITNAKKSIVGAVLNNSDDIYDSKIHSQNTSFCKKPDAEKKGIDNEKLLSNIPDEENTSEDKGSFPKGLDGIDYENETYPESYYEQPVHQHNYSSLASNVILEEDENETDVEHPEAFSIENLNIPNNQYHLADKTPALNHLNSNFFQINEDVSESLKGENSQESNHDRSTSSTQSTSKKYDQVKVQSSDFENNFKTDKQNFKAAEVIVETPVLFRSQNQENLKPAPIYQSTVARLLDSDSESFQVEHGDLMSGHEDSDFDFNFT